MHDQLTQWRENLKMLRREFTRANEQLVRSLEADDLTTARHLIHLERVLMERLDAIINGVLKPAQPHRSTA